MKVRMKRLRPFLLMTICIAGSMAAQAAIRVTLRSGADVVCDHQQAIGSDTVRLYLTAGDENYLDIKTSEILRQEPVAETPMSSPIAAAPRVSRTNMVPAPADLAALLQKAGAQHHLDPDLLASVVHAESGGHVNAVSRAGARGLMQLMPATAADLGVQNSFAADQNVAGGTTYLDALLMYYHDNLALALAAYNAGPAAVARYHGIPPYPETRRYVARIIHEYNQRKRREAREQPVRSAAGAMAAAVILP